MARPSEYKESYVDSVYEYLTNYEEYDEVIPTVEGFAVYLSVSKQTIYNWAKEHKEFLDALDDMRAKQSSILQNKGLEGKFNSTITKLILSANHGMSEKNEVEHKGELNINLVHYGDQDSV